MKDDANTEILKKYILKHIGNQDLNIENYSADFFHELMKSQGREDFFQITDNDVKSLIDDSEAMKFGRNDTCITEQHIN